MASNVGVDNGNESVVLCKNCSKPCFDKTEGKKNKELQYVKCEECGDAYHKMCTDIGNKEWDLVTGSNESILFKCPPCLVNKGKKFQEIKELKNEISSLRSEMASLKNLNSEVASLKELFVKNNEALSATLIKQLEASMFPKVEVMIDQKLKQHAESTEKKYEDRIKKLEQDYEEVRQVEPQPAAISKSVQEEIESKIKTQVTQSIDEIRELEERKKNLIIFGVKESETENEEEAESEDFSKVKEILSHSNPELVNKEIKEIDLSNMTRMGSKKEDATKPRPIKLTLKDNKTKFKFLKNSYKMKDCETHKNIGFKMDLTKKQQEEDKVLRLELAERKKNEDVMIYKKQVLLRSEVDKLKKLQQESIEKKKKESKGPRDHQKQ